MELNVSGKCKNCIKKKIARLKKKYGSSKVVASATTKAGRTRWQATVTIKQ